MKTAPNTTTGTTQKQFRVGEQSTHFLNALHHLNEAEEALYYGATHRIGEKGADLIHPINAKIEEAKEDIFRYLRIHIEALMCDTENAHREQMEI